MRGRSPITEETVQAAFDWLNESPDHAAAKRVGLMRAEYKVKRVFARLCRSIDGSVEARKWAATCNEEYIEAQEEELARFEEWERVLDQRKKCELIIEAWRTQQASDRGARF
jgi:hypothetical protein